MAEACPETPSDEAVPDAMKATAPPGETLKLAVCRGDCSADKPNEKCTLYFEPAETGCLAKCKCWERTPSNPRPKEFTPPPHGWDKGYIVYEPPIKHPGPPARTETCTINAQLNAGGDKLFVWCSGTCKKEGQKKPECGVYYWQVVDPDKPKEHTLHVGCGCYVPGKP